MNETSPPPDADAELDRMAQEFVDRARCGEAPSIEDYARAHPALAEGIRELFPVLALVEGLKDEDGSGAPSGARTPASGPPPDRIGAYRIVREIGRGGMGTVYEGVPLDAEDAEIDDRVAIKVVHPHLLERPEFVARFLREAELGRRLSHERVVRTLATGLVDRDGDEVPFIVLEYVAGQNLRSLLEEVEVVPERLCRHVGACIADALTAVHDVGLVHRDVKPENVVITADETVKLMDLGVAVLQDPMQRLSRTGQFVGSPLYAAPDQIAGGEPRPDWDLHALGVLLYELSTGRHPLHDLGPRWLRIRDRQHDQDAPALPRAADVSPFFHAVVRRLLGIEDGAGFASASEVRKVLEDGERSAWWRARPAHIRTGGALPEGLERPTPFYGRRAEWTALDAQLADAETGRGRTVLVVGDAGMGKSRLLHEWIAARARARTSVRAIVVPHGPQAVLGEEGRLTGALLDALGEADLEARLRSLLGSRAPLAEALARRMRGEIDPDAPPLPSQSVDAAYLQLLRGLSREHVLVLALEDLHFASPEDREHFVRLARALRDDAVLLIGTTRPVDDAAWIAQFDAMRHASRLELTGLEPDAFRELLHDATEGLPPLDVSAASLAARSDRNPYFLLELVREHARRAARSGTQPTPTDPVPESIRGLLGARIATLEAADRELLEVAACAGHEFDPLLVARAAGLGRVAALKALGRIERERRLVRSAGRHHQFQHHLVQEVLVEEMHPALQEAYHVALGTALESEPGPVDAERSLALTLHFFEGAQPLRSRPYLPSALDHLSETLFAYARADALANRALAVPGLVEGALRARAISLGTALLVASARRAEAEPALSEALTLAREAGDLEMEAEILRRLGWLYTVMHRKEEAHRAYTDAAERARESGEPDHEAEALGLVAMGHWQEGRTDEAEACIQRAFAALEGRLDPFSEARLTTYLASIELQRRNVARAQELVEHSHEVAHGVGDLATEFLNLSTLGQLAFRTGRFRTAIERGRGSLDLGRQLGWPHREVELLSNLAACHLELGEIDAAEDLARQAKDHALTEDLPDHVAHARMQVGVVLTARGTLAEAREEIEVALDAIHVEGERPLHVSTLAALADLLSLLGRHDESARHLEHATALLGARSSAKQGLVLVARARGRERAGRWDEAVASWQEARAKASEFGVPPERHAVSLGRALLATDRREEGEKVIAEGREWSRERGIVRSVVLANAWLAWRADGDVLAARVALEQHEAALAAADRIEAHWVLWEASGDDAHLDAAWEALRRLRARSPPEERDRMVDEVDVHHRIAVAVRLREDGLQRSGERA